MDRHPYLTLAATLLCVYLLVDVAFDRSQIAAFVVAIAAALGVAKFVLKDPDTA